MPSTDVPLFDLPVEESAPARTAPPVDRPGPQPALFETAEVLLSPLPAWATKLAVFDLETTGIDVDTSRIVTANVSRLDATGAVIRRRDWLADPGVEIPLQATAIHGVATAHARAEGRPAAEVVADLVAELRSALEDGYALVVYNAPYDFTLLAREAARHGVEPLVEPAPVIDPLVIDRHVDRYRKGKRTLEATAGTYGVELIDAHDAGADAIAAGRVAQAIGLRHGAALELTLAELHDAQHAWHDAQCDSFEDYMRRTRDPNYTARRGWPEIPAPAAAPAHPARPAR
jgi:DNA polymerase-3 subunit epsilon